MRIAGVGVNPKKLPSKDKLIEQALKGVRYYQLPKKKALSLIEQEIKQSGLFNTSTKRVKKSDSNTSKPRKSRNSTKRKLDKKDDKK